MTLLFDHYGPFESSRTLCDRLSFGDAEAARPRNWLPRVSSGDTELIRENIEEFKPKVIAARSVIQ